MHGSKEVLLADMFPATYALTGLSVYNWGPFQHRHSAVIDQSGTAVIGPTGSGKTTLVDAFMTLICAQPKYNLASTGGHESDRDLMSYVRGRVGAGNDTNSTDHITRPNKTITAIEASFHNGDKPILIAAVLWIDSSSGAISDLKRAWIFCENTKYTIKEFLELQQEGGMRALKQLGRDMPDLYVSDNKKSYLAQLRRFFEVGENAFTLLNRAAGLKQLNSIDNLFRELVLDDHSAFIRAAEVAAEFDDLASIHGELETARQQQQSLQPIAVEYDALLKHKNKLEIVRRLQNILPVWYAEHGCQLWSREEAVLFEKLQASEKQCAGLKAQIQTAEQQVDKLRDIYMQSGGASIELLTQQIDNQNQMLANCKHRAVRYQQIAAALDLDTALSIDTLLSNQKKAGLLSAQQQLKLEEKQEKAFEWGAIGKNHQDKVDELEAEIEKITHSQSNIPGNFFDFQCELSKAFGLDTERLPFAAELIEVKPEQKQWRGAIERAIGGHRLRLLVASKIMKQALAWVNKRHNKLHVRLLRVEESYPQVQFFDDGFTRKLNFKTHPYREAVKKLAAGLDRHCVDSVDDLQKTPRGMTRQGLMSGRAGYFDKQDHHRLDQNWMTGFDNRDRLASLHTQLKQAREAFDSSQQKVASARQACTQLEKQIGLLRQIEQENFTDIDVPGLQASLEALQQQLQAVRDPASDTAQAQKRWMDAKTQLQTLRNKERDSDLERDKFKRDNQEARNNKERLSERIGGGLTEEEKSLGDARFKEPTLALLAEQEKHHTKKLQEDLESCNGRISKHEANLIRLMAQAQKIDTGALAATGTEQEDVPNYIEQLRVLSEEALPEKQARFLEYLNQSSDQGVTQLLMNIESEVDKIRYRIDALNQTMRHVDYQSGRYLRLEPNSVSHESLDTLKKAQQHLRYAATQDDNGESHYKALQTVVTLLRDASERKRTKGAQALLDPRYRLQFFVSVIERDTAQVIEKRSGSQGGSGGEKEIIASYILTASLSYALCPEGSSAPLFGTVVLDEAFSRSSQAVASRIIAALREFGLHPLFITPNKEIKLLRTHTRSAVLIHKKGLHATMTSLSWEQLEEQAEKQRTKHHEVTE